VGVVRQPYSLCRALATAFRARHPVVVTARSPAL
jgi:hypothetical protein